MDFNLLGRISRTKPQLGVETDDKRIRVDRYGNLVTSNLVPSNQSLVEEESYFVGTNPTIGTGVVWGGATQTAWVATTPSVALINNAPQGGVRAFPDYLKMMCTAAGVATTSYDYAVIIEDRDRLKPFLTTDVAVTAVNPNMDSTARPMCSLSVGLLVASAASGKQRITGRGRLRSQINVISDQYVINFGGNGGGAVNLAGPAITTAIMSVQPTPAVVIGPGQALLIYFWGAAMTTSPSFEFEFGWYER